MGQEPGLNIAEASLRIRRGSAAPNVEADPPALRRFRMSNPVTVKPVSRALATASRTGIEYADTANTHAATVRQKVM